MLESYANTLYTIDNQTISRFNETWIINSMDTYFESEERFTLPSRNLKDLFYDLFSLRRPQYLYQHLWNVGLDKPTNHTENRFGDNHLIGFGLDHRDVEFYFEHSYK